MFCFKLKLEKLYPSRETEVSVIWALLIILSFGKLSFVSSVVSIVSVVSVVSVVSGFSVDSVVSVGKFVSGLLLQLIIKKLIIKNY